MTFRPRPSRAVICHSTAFRGPDKTAFSRPPRSVPAATIANIILTPTQACPLPVGRIGPRELLPSAAALTGGLPTFWNSDAAWSIFLGILHRSTCSTKVVKEESYRVANEASAHLHTNTPVAQIAHSQIHAIPSPEIPLVSAADDAAEWDGI